jgi:hypothetical protein
MNTKIRIQSILNAASLDYSITGIPSFNLSELNIPHEKELQLPTNLRLGHLAEAVVGHLIKSSVNNKLLYENIQLIENKSTIGEIDFIIEKIETKQLYHLELAYKFYLFDPNISDNQLNNWVGPNRSDTLKEKLEKLKSKQLPLLYHNTTISQLPNIDISKVSQVLCFLVSLYLPYSYQGQIDTSYQKAIKGYYLNLDEFIRLNNAEKLYYIPSMKEWGIDPSDNDFWMGLNGVVKQITKSIDEKRSILCWQKHKNSFQSFFVVWW